MTLAGLSRRPVLAKIRCFKLTRRYHLPIPLLEDLTQRGFIQDVTRPDALRDHIQFPGRILSAYAGVDPTAKSLHIGHLIPLLALLHFQIRGHHIIPLIGGATGRVGDPSGRREERELAKTEHVEENITSLTNNLKQFFQRASLYASRRLAHNEQPCQEPKVKNNIEWHGKLTLLNFLQNVGVHARVNTMLNRESVQARLEAKQGLSFTELTYQLLQAYDFYYLHRNHNCVIQIGGSDQWGNIVAGLDLIGKLDATADSNPAFGITTPLLTTSNGEKFGKSAGNAVWLDPHLTSIFDFYQYFLKVADADVKKYLNLFTLMPQEEINELVSVHETQPEKQQAQRRLAAEVTEMVHLEEGVTHAVTKTKLMFDSDYANLKVEDVLLAFDKDPRLVRAPMGEILETPITKLSARHGLVTSNGAARSLVASRGLYLNNKPVETTQSKIGAVDLIEHKMAILRAGKDKILVLVAGEQ